MPPVRALSRRNWLFVMGGAGVVSLVPGCLPPLPELTRLPATGSERARPLSERGVRNLLALAELSAALRWLHPSDEALAAEWEPLLLEGVRGLEAAATPAELAEGLRGLFGSVAPTLVIWRAEKEDAADLDANACEPEASEAEDRARAGEDTQTRGKAESERPGPPARSNQEAAKQESGESTSSESKTELPKVLNPKSTDPEAKREDRETPDDAGEERSPGAPPKLEKSATKQGDAGEAPADVEGEDANSSDEESEDEIEIVEDSEDKPEEKTGEKAAEKPAEKTEDKPKEKTGEKIDEVEPRPDLPAALLESGDSIVQWHRRGFASADDDDDTIACARRLRLDPDTRRSCTEPPSKPRRRKHESESCSLCSSEHFDVLVPAQPLELALPRGLKALVPLALWAAEGDGEPAPAFDLERSLEYVTSDRATRLLVVIQAWSMLRWFFPHPPSESQQVLREALCIAAEQDTTIPALDLLHLRFGDGNASVQMYLFDVPMELSGLRPRAGFAWVAERMVVYPLPGRADELSPLELGDVVVEIDGVPIEQRLADRLPRTAAATASARIARTVDRLVEIRSLKQKRLLKKWPLRLTVLRETPSGEQRVSVELDTGEPSESLPSGGDLRPDERLTELRPGTWYIDATRVPNLRAAARRLRHAEKVIVDLRGTLADERRTLAGHWASEPLHVLDERLRVGPSREGTLTLEPFATHMLEPLEPRLRAKLVVLADHRTRGRAELELAGFARLGAPIVGSNSAGDLARVAHAWLPGLDQFHFSYTDALLSDGTPVWGRGIAPTHFCEPSWPAARERDELLDMALQLLE